MNVFGIAIYRGCTDGFTDVPSLEYSYVGCRNQSWNNRNLRWCVCNSTLCNGDSLEAMARRSPYSRHLVTPPPVPPYRRPVPVDTKTKEDVHGRSAVASDDAKAGLYQPWNPEPLFHGGPYLWNPNNKPFRTYRKTSFLKPNTHRRRRRDETVLSRRVGVGGVYMNSQLAHDDCRRIRRCERSRRP